MNPTQTCTLALWKVETGGSLGLADCQLSQKNQTETKNKQTNHEPKFRKRPISKGTIWKVPRTPDTFTA